MTENGRTVLQANGDGDEGVDDLLLDSPVFLLLLSESRDRELLASWLSSWGTVRTATSPDALDEGVDLCVLDRERITRFADELAAVRADADPVFLPYVLLETRDAASVPPETWNRVDDVVGTPIRKRLLRARIDNLLGRRASSLRLREREEQLEEALSDLRRAKRAMDEAPVGITVTGPLSEDTPIEYANQAFLDLSDHDADEVLGQNPRLLQGSDTDPATRAAIHDALAARESVSVDVLNYTGEGARFWNKLDVVPLADHEETGYVGFQTDVTERKLREQRLDVLNRVLRHNLRNEMNVVAGYADELERAVSSPEDRSALDRIRRAASRLIDLSEEVYRTETVFEALEGDTARVELSVLCERVRDAVSEDVRLDVDLPAETYVVDGRNLALACREVVATLAEYDASPRPAVHVEATFDGHGLELTVTDPESRLPAGAWQAVARGVETPLEHTDRIRLWLAHWVLSLAGGSLRFDETAGDAGATAHLWIPVYTNDRRT